MGFFSSSPLVRDDPRSRAVYAEGAGIYRIVPSAVAVPASVADLIDLVVIAARSGQALIPRGSGTGMAGGNVGDGLLLDLTRLDPGRVAVDPERRIARCSAAVTCAALLRAAAVHGLRLPVPPSSWPWATLGGMAATNAAGARSFRYGSFRRWVRGLTLLTADGELLTLERGRAPARSGAAERFAGIAPDLLASAALIRGCFPPVRKNSAGYALDAWLASDDLLDLVIGSEGTLGVVTELVVGLDPEPAWRGGLRVTLPDDDALGPALRSLRQSGASSLELLDRTFLDFVRDQLPPEDRGLGDAGAVLLVEFEGDRAQVERSLRRWAGTAVPGAAGVAIADGPAAFENLWAIRHAASPLLARLGDHRRSLQVVEDGCVPPDRLPEYVRQVRAITAGEGVPAVLFGHAGDGHLHVNLLPDTAAPGWALGIARVYERVSDAVLALGGTPAGEHGAGRLRTGLLDRLYGPRVVELFRRVKHAFDPDGIFNPGVIVPADAAQPLDQLKVGADAAPLPPDITRALREVERGGGYGRLRMDLA